MKNWIPIIRIHFAYPWLFNAPDGVRRFISTRVLIGGTALLVAAIVVGLRLLTRISHPAPTPQPTLAWAAPFVVLLGGIALIPAIIPRWWDKYYSWFCMGLGVLAALSYWLMFGAGAVDQIAGSLSLYLDFIVMIGVLFIIASGIVVRTDQTSSPNFNVLLLVFAVVLANVFGSVGASALLARPFFRMNRGHVKPFHVVFFVLIVANVGASLTALGNPPLLLGFLTGVPFWWITIHAWPVWLTATGLLLAIFYLLDHRSRRNPVLSPPLTQPPEEEQHGPMIITFEGSEQLLLLVAALAALFLPSPWRDAAMVAAASVSLLICPKALRKENLFTFQPIREIAILFLGIFLTMAPVLNMLSNEAHGGNLRNWLNTPGKCYFITGALSSFLDNAPTYMAMLEARLEQSPGNASTTTATALTGKKSSPNITGKSAQSVINKRSLRKQLAKPAIALDVLAVSLGAVFFGGLTWIGNAPNMMIHAIAEQEGIACPGFLSYFFRYAIPCLAPVLVIIWLLFLH